MAEKREAGGWTMEPDEVMATSPVIPVVVIERREQAVPLAKALLRGGIPIIEVTLRSGAALDAMEEITRRVPELLVGAGTVLSSEDLGRVAEAGARFAISPGMTPGLLQAARRGPIPLIPGVSTISELMVGMELGYTHFKLFPAGAVGGIRFLKAVAGPLPHATFCPTGGISQDDFLEYLALPNVACVGGSWVAPPSLIERGQWDAIARLAREAVERAGKAAGP